MRFIHPRLLRSVAIAVLGACVIVLAVRSAIGRAVRDLAAAGTTYYVAPTGNDADPGTIDRPWRTLAKAATSLAAGDTVLVRGGTYREAVTLRASGTTGAPITLAAYPGEIATLDGTGLVVVADGGVLHIDGASNVTVRGLRVVNSSGAGIYVTNASAVTVDGTVTYNTFSSGIGVWWSRDATITGNDVGLACNGGPQECITVAGTDGFLVATNRVHDGGPSTNGAEGIDAKEGSANGKICRNHVDHTQALGIYVDAWDKYTHDIEVFGNVVHDTLANNGLVLASEAGGLLERIKVYNNVAYNNRYSGIVISRNGLAATHPMRAITIVNNTFVNNGGADWGGGISVDNPTIESVVIRNNICSQNSVFQIEVEPDVPTGGLAIDHNLIDGFRGYQSETYGSASVAGDAQFVDLATADFHLRASSPAIDRGSAAEAPAFDFDGYARPVGAGFDIGAFEYGAAPPRRLRRHLGRP